MSVVFEALSPENVKALRLLNSVLFPVKFHVRWDEGNSGEAPSGEKGAGARMGAPQRAARRFCRRCC